MNEIEAKSRKVVKPPPKPTKLCLKCGRVRQLESEYYVNKDWEDQLGRDIWCKECVNRCTTKEEIKEYFWENHRDWNERIWDMAHAKAEKMLLNNATYQKSSEARKKVMMERLTAQQVPAFMQTMYKYVENGKDGRSLTYAEAKANGEIVEDAKEERVYSDFFNGYFSKKDLEYLENYYSKLEEDFNFDNESTRDYARKVCKASLQADKAQDDFAAGKCSFADVKDALAQFDMLSKSANFAACRRKVGDTSGLTSWAETTYKLETTGHTMQRKIEWPEDDVDKVTNALRYLITSLGLDSL